MLKARQKKQETGCSSIYECIEKDANLKRRHVAIMKIFAGISKNGKHHVTISYQTLASKSLFARTQTMLTIKELVAMGYISKKQVGGKHQHDANVYVVHIPKEYKKWLNLPVKRPIDNSLKRLGEYSTAQKIEMAKRTLKAEGVVGDDEMNHAIKQTILRKAKEKLDQDKGLIRLVKQSKINHAIQKTNSDLMAKLTK